MIGKLTEETQEILGKSELIIITERVDDVALLIGLMKKMGLQEILDNHIPKHWKQRSLSWGWTAVIWLAYIMSEGDHRKVSVRKYIEGMQNTLSQVTGQQIEPLDFTDDRLGCLLKYLSKPKYWPKIENELNEKTIKISSLPIDTIRCDATTVSGNHQVKSGGLIQFGHNKDNSNLPQFKLMVGALDPLGMPLATDVVSGEQADDSLYLSVIKRIDESLNQSDLLYEGDCKMSAFDIRLHIVGQKNHYLSPLPLTGQTAKEMESWIDEGVQKELDYQLELIFRNNEKDEKVLVAGGYEFERKQCGSLDGKEIKWIERVLVIKSPAHAEQQIKGLEKRLTTAMEKIRVLTPEKGRGKRQITDEKQLLEAIEKRLKEQRVMGLLTVEYEKQTEREIRYVGKGRGSKNRKQQVIKKVRYSILNVIRKEEEIANAKERFGWKAFVTNAAKARLSLSEAVLSYRHEYRVERIFNRLKNRLNIAPVFVKRNEQITGLTHLLTLGVRVLTLLEFVVRRSLEEDKATLTRLHPENPKKANDRPTAERLLKAFSNISLTIIKNRHGEIKRHLTPLSNLQMEILNRLELDSFLYLNLEMTT